MKRCPECRRDYYDETLIYCLDDGNALLEGPASKDEPATAILSAPPSESPTRPQIHTAEAEPQTSADRLQSFSASRAAKRLAVLIVVMVVLVGGLFGYRYFRSASTEQINSVAVLPFDNRSGTADADYLSDGLADSLIYRLSQLPNLKVSPTSSVMRYKGGQTDVAEIAKELEVDAVMSGRLVQLGDDLSISVQLIDSRSKKLIWAEQYDRKMSALLATQREIAQTITQKLQLKLAGNDTTAITKRYTDNNEAYQLYLKARFYFAKRTAEDTPRSIELFQQAINLDPKFALAYVGLSEVYSSPGLLPSENSPLARAAVGKALELDPDLPEAHTVAGIIAATYDWDWTKAEREFKRSLELDPNLAITHWRCAWNYLSPLGRHDEAIAEMKRAQELEPVSLIQNTKLAGVFMYARQYDLALEQAKRTYELDPNFIVGQTWLCHIYNLKGLYSESLAIAEKSANTQFDLNLAYAYAKLGRRVEAEQVLARWHEAEKTKYDSNYGVAGIYAALGDKDKAFAELEKAYQSHDWFLQRIKVDPFLDPLRDDPRFNEMVKRLNLPV